MWRSLDGGSFNLDYTAYILVFIFMYIILCWPWRKKKLIRDPPGGSIVVKPVRRVMPRLGDTLSVLIGKDVLANQ